MPELRVLHKSSIRTLCSLVVLSCRSLVSAESSGVSAVEKVIQLLDGMLQKGQEAVHAEERHYSDFQQWCETTQTDLKVQISELSDAISVEHAHLDDFSQASDDLKQRISEHQLAIGHHEGDKSATKVRAIDKDDNDAQGPH